MSRIVNLKTIRFQTFNVLDSWYTNWSDNYNYATLLHEDLGIRSYFFGICYRLKMPSNYVYIHRMANNRLLLTHDIYLLRPLHKSKLKYFFIEQKLYLKFLLKLMFYITPYLFRSISIISESRMSRYIKRVLPIKRILYLTNRLSYIPLAVMYVHPVFNRLYSLRRRSNKMCYIESAHMFNGLLLLSNRNRLITTARRSIIPFCNGTASIIGNLTVRLLYVMWFRFNIMNCVSYLNELLLYIGLRYHTYILKYRHLIQIDNFDSILRVLQFHRTQNRLSVLSRRKRSFSMYLKPHYTFKYRVRYNELIAMLEQYQNYRMIGRVRLKYFDDKFKSQRFLYWFYNNKRVGLSIILLKCILLLILIQSYFKQYASRLVKYISKLITMLFMVRTHQLFFARYITCKHRAILDTFKSTKMLVPYLNNMRRIKAKFFKKRKIIMSLRAVPRFFKYGPMLLRFVKTLNMYVCNHIESILMHYTKLNVFLFLSLYITRKRNFPPMLNAKMICDYLVYLIHGNRSVKYSFYKIRQWQASNASRRLTLERLFFASRFKKRPKRYLEHFAFKKYPLFGIRIECSGNAKKGRMSKKLFYGDIIHNTGLTQKAPNDTLGADLDYYQSYAITKSCSIGIKVWAFFKTHLYNSNGKIASFLFY